MNINNLNKNIINEAQEEKKFTNFIQPQGLAWLRTPLEAPMPIIDGLFYPHQTGFVVAQPKIGKTWFVMNMALSLARGNEPFVCWQINEPCNVLYFQTELDEWEAQKRLLQVEKSLNEKYGSKPIDSRFWHLPFISYSSVGELFNYLQYQCNKLNIDVLIIDPIYQILINENDPALVNDFCSKLNEFKQKCNTAIIMVHHTSKGDCSDKELFELLSGNSITGRYANFIVGLAMHEKNSKESFLRTIRFQTRGFPPVYDRISCEFKDFILVPDLSIPAIEKSRNSIRRDNSQPSINEKVILDFLKEPTQKDVFKSKITGMVGGIHKTKAYVGTLIADKKILEKAYHGFPKKVYVCLPEDEQKIGKMFDEMKITALREKDKYVQSQL